MAVERLNKLEDRETGSPGEKKDMRFERGYPLRLCVKKTKTGSPLVREPKKSCESFNQHNHSSRQKKDR
jgi:hypothetical protein